jgi:hypothetical protein
VTTHHHHPSHTHTHTPPPTHPRDFFPRKKNDHHIFSSKDDYHHPTTHPLPHLTQANWGDEGVSSLLLLTHSKIFRCVVEQDTMSAICASLLANS